MTNRIALTCLSLIAFWVMASYAPSTGSGDDTWNQWRGPERNGNWQGPLPKSLSGVKLAWEKSLQPSYSGPVSDGELVFTTATVDDTFERVVAFELSTGEVRWTAQWKGAIEVPGYAAANGSWIKSTPAITEDALVVLGMRDVVVCLDPSTGEKRWQVDLASRFGTRRPPFGGVCSPLIDEQAVYLMGGGATVKLSLADGSPIWRTLADEGEEDDALSSPVIATLAGRRQLVVQTRTRLCGVGLNDGSVLWSEPIQAYRNMNILTPLVMGNRVFTAARGGRSHCFEIGLDHGRWTVEEVWNQKVQGYMSSPVSEGNTIFLHSNSERLTALDARSGDILWTGRPMGKYQSLVGNGDVILALNSEGELLAIETSRDRLNVIDRAKVANDSWAYLGVFEGGLLVRDLKSLKVYQY